MPDFWITIAYPVVDYAFRIVFRADDGSEYILQDFDVSPAGQLQRFCLSAVLMEPLAVVGGPREYRMKPTGAYKGTLIITTAHAEAQRNPIIKASWDGTVEFPIAFEFIELKEASVK